MGRPYQILIPLLSLFFTRVDLTDLIPLKYDVQVLEILDGDTLIVGINHRRIKLRLSRIDAPEKGQPFIDGQGDAGKESKRCLEDALKKITSIEVAIEGTDIYGRSLGDIVGLSYMLIQKGCASLYPYARFSSKTEKYQYMRAHAHAKSRHIGLWFKGGYQTPKLWRKSHRHQRK